MGVITFNGITSSSLGVEVETFPDYVAPQKEYEAVHVPGRNGDVLIDTGTYQNVPRTYKVNAATRNITSFPTKMNAIVEWLHSASGYARLEDTYDPDFYRMAYYNGDVTITNIFNEAGKADLEFICKPQKFYKSGEQSIQYSSSGTINNFTNHPSLPILNIVSNNTLEEESDIVGTVYIGNYAISIKKDDTIPAGTNITIIADCELQNAYSEVLGETINRNNLIVLNGEDMPKIDPGVQNISFDGGIQSVEVIPRWWTV